jgi:hypothetical protein
VLDDLLTEFSLVERLRIMRNGGVKITLHFRQKMKGLETTIKVVNGCTRPPFSGVE